MKNLKTAALATLVGIFVFISCEKKAVVQNPNEQTELISTPEIPSNNEPVINAEQELPKNVRTFLNEYYPNIQISKAEVKTKLGAKEYEIKLNNGVEVEFDTEENWKEIKDYNGVPDALVPAKVKTYVNQNYKNIKIESIDNKTAKNKMKVDLLNGVDLEFDMDGNFLRIDR